MRSVELAKSYDPAEVEPRLYERWERSGVFHEEPDPARPPFIISMPPPNITGRAHLGHGSTYTAMDILTRYHRMLGENADWLPGQDHAAIATEAVLVRELAREGLTRDGLGREKYFERAWQWREEYGGIIYEQFRTLGFGPDWARDRFTMDPGLSAAVVKVFVELYREGLIYRGVRLINWDVGSKSTLSDAEIENQERAGTLWHLRYRSEDGTGEVVVATTRPETMLGDTAVAVHPDDGRYRHLVGKTFVLPILGRRIPMIADAAVEREFGTGAVKVTPAHDPLDYEIGLRHNLPMPTVIGFDGKMTAEAGPFAGRERFEAREAVVERLRADGALVRTEPYAMKVPVSERSGQIVEPLLSLQWFCKMEPLAKPALEAYRDGRIRFVPERFGRTYEQWLENIRDWNVSRQIWWGHQLPVWYTPDEHVVVAETEEEARTIARETYGTDELRRDPDTLDTWFSSGLWPFSILGWPDRTPELEHWYPNQVMITAREIIFLWVARMVMLGMKFVGKIPFQTVFITPLVFDMQGRKMSKSLGNAIDPMDLVAKYGADGTRFGIVRQMRLESQELNFDERFADEARRFANKLWNALRYIRALPEGLPPAGTLPTSGELSLADRWILTRLAATAREVTDALYRFELGLAADKLLRFGWYEYCDWYLESTKLGGATRAAVLSYVLNALARLMHPIAPFVTEELWQALPHDGETIVTASWPDAGEIIVDDKAAEKYDVVRGVVERLRNARHEFGMNERAKLTVLAPAPLGREREVLDLIALHAGAEIVAEPANEGSFADLMAAITVRAPVEQLRERYAKELSRLRAEVERGEKKLSSESFVARAPADVVAKEREKLEAYRRELERTERLLVEVGGR
ncbi:MAG: valine--tRNA ligase [Candidatus Eremiobacteraeota bacterium]|nr:valine--tRNA ligase [Candidatus Eremiobacteraeota bacterium]